MKAPRIAALAGFILVLAALAGVGRPDAARGIEEDRSQAAGNPRQISVTGTGSVMTVPNQAELSFGVVSQAGTARAALAANSAEMRRVIEALKDAGIDGDDIQTEQVSLSARYADNDFTIIGYTAQNSVGTKLRKLDGAGTVVDAAVAAGANQVYGPTLIRSDRTELYRNALKAAVADAREKAQVLAGAGGVSLGRVAQVIENSASGPVFSEQAGRADIAAAPVEPGTQLVEANVSVTFDIS